MYRILASFLIILASIILSPPNSEAQISVELQDTSIARGTLSVIPVYGELLSASDGDLQLTVRFNAYVIDIKRIITDASTSLVAHDFSVNLSNIESSLLVVTSDNYKKQPDGVLFFLEVEGLAGPDTSTMVVPISIKIGGVEQEGAVFDSGTISVQSVPVGPKLTEGLGQNFPNPFNVYTEVFFSVDSDSKVSFKIFSLGGRNVFGPELNTFVTEIFDESGNQIDNYLEHTFAAGRYRMRLTPASWEISAGAYYLVMAVQDQVYKTNFIYYK